MCEGKLHAIQRRQRVVTNPFPFAISPPNPGRKPKRFKFYFWRTGNYLNSDFLSVVYRGLPTFLPPLLFVSCRVSRRRTTAEDQELIYFHSTWTSLQRCHLNSALDIATWKRNNGTLLVRHRYNIILDVKQRFEWNDSSSNLWFWFLFHLPSDAATWVGI